MIALCSSLLVTLLLVEGGLRLVWDGFYVKNPGDYKIFHPTRFWAGRPDVSIRRGEPEWVMEATHNSLGFRGPEVLPEKDPSRLRLLALGDSFTYGVGVHDDETFCARLQQLEPGLEVINTGVNAYGTAQELLLLEEEGLALAPDIVMVNIFWNDIANSFHRPLGFALEDGELRYTPSERPRKDDSYRDRRRLARHSYAYRFLSDRIKLARFRIQAMFGDIDHPDVMSESDTEKAWALHLALLGEIVRRSEAEGARVLIVVIPDQVQIHPDTQGRVIGLHPRLFEIQDRLVAFGRERGVPVLDLAPGLKKAAEPLEQEIYYPKDRHFVAEGNRLVAELIRDELRRLQWIGG